ncbi:hypothetical protein FQR65_LT20970 [Abscondita terminalis]|nr:hypothetical protein FQR65_LT20970 [Abscondita terminalis]
MSAPATLGSETHGSPRAMAVVLPRGFLDRPLLAICCADSHYGYRYDNDPCMQPPESMCLFWDADWWWRSQWRALNRLPGGALGCAALTRASLTGRTTGLLNACLLAFGRVHPITSPSGDGEHILSWVAGFQLDCRGKRITGI